MTNPRVMTTATPAAPPPGPALMRRGFPGPASAISVPVSLHLYPALLERGTPVPTPAHDFPRAIRVRRSPR